MQLNLYVKSKIKIPIISSFTVKESVITVMPNRILFLVLFSQQVIAYNNLALVPLIPLASWYLAY